MDRKLIIAIDGYSSCGKSTFAKAIAKELGYIYIDSGAMYRAVTLFCLRKGYIGNSVFNLERIIADLPNIHIGFVYNPDIHEYETLLNSENVEKEIRGFEVSNYVSRISQIPEIRTGMVRLQRQTCANKGIVMDGRDIGTVVFPDADLKIFMTASVDIRAKRRFEELKGKNINVDYEDVKTNIIARDIADENREISPLRRAEDAVILDNTRMSVAEQMDWLMKIIHSRENGG
jgi:cytidylate kinase